jgi:hypothetical protein
MAVGGFPDDIMLGDTVFCWRLAEDHIPLWLEPAAVADHHHFITLRTYMRERIERGREFALLRAGRERWSRTRLLIFLCLSLSPLRLGKLLARVAQHSWAAGMGADYLWAFPWIWLGQAAWLVGEASGYAHQLLPPGRSNR